VTGEDDKAAFSIPGNTLSAKEISLDSPFKKEFLDKMILKYTHNYDVISIKYF
jgi:hypothetical protein